MFLLVAACMVWASAYAAGDSKPFLIAAMGDSLTAASLANLDGPSRDYDPVRDGSDVSDGGEVEPDLEEMGIDYLVTNKKTFSWVTGRKIQSHRRLLEMYLKSHGETRKLGFLNAARPGKRALDLEYQANLILKASRSKSYHSVKYVAVLIGNNDACAGSPAGGTPIDQMKVNLRAGFKKLAEISQDDPIPVLVSGLPRIMDLGEERIRRARTFMGITCEKFRNDIFNLCASLVTWTSDAEYREKLAIVENTNQAIFEAAMEAREEFPNLDIFYTDRLWSEHISADHLAIDCFHPSPVGQEAIAASLWEEQPWFK